jgi:hypothetical protein
MYKCLLKSSGVMLAAYFLGSAAVAVFFFWAESVTEHVSNTTIEISLSMNYIFIF